MKKIIRLAAVLTAAAVLLSGCSAASPKDTAAAVSTETAAEDSTGTADSAVPKASPERKGESTTGTGFYFDTVVMVRLYDAEEGVMDEIWDACKKYEAMLSKTVEGSDVWKINHAEGETVQVSEDTWSILQTAKQVNEQSGGAFCVTLAPVTELWDFTGGTERMPTDSERLAALEKVDDSKLVLGDHCEVTLPAGMAIDLGGIAKGYIADRIAELVEGRVSGATLNFGGNVYVVGLKPDSSEYRVGIRDPEKTDSDSIVIVTVHDNSVVTSGIYERYFIKDGVRYHHILDPKTGISSDSDLASATIINTSSMTADALATVCVVLGSEKAKAFLQENGYDGIFVTRDNQVIVTDNFPYKLEYVSQQ